MLRQEKNRRTSFLRWLKEELTLTGIEDVQEAERILEEVLGLTRTELYLDPEKEVSVDAKKRVGEILESRKKRVPLAYLFKKADFWHETLYVDERCLIPRPETEILVEQVLKALGERAGKEFSFLDIGTGSGAIAIAILRAFKHAHGTLLDISPGALEVARINLEKYGLQDRARLVVGDCLKGLAFRHPEARRAEGSQDEILRFAQNDGLNGEKFHLIVSNPPYLSEEDWNGVQEELKFEPRGALDGGKDGLDFYRKIISSARDLLASGGLLAMEVGQGQAEMVSKWLHEAGYDNIQRFNDHLQVQRVVMAQRHS